MNFNQASVAGNVTKDPELRTLPSGQKACSFTVATHRVFTDGQGQKQEETEFHGVVTWAKQAEIASQYLKKGALVLVRGKRPATPLRKERIYEAELYPRGLS